MRNFLGLAVIAVTIADPAAPAPPSRAHHPIVYDGAAVIVAGGSTRTPGPSGPFYRDTWSWDGEQWTQGPDGTVAQSGQRLAYDSRRDRVLSFGGFDGAGVKGSLLELKDGSWRTLEALDRHPAAEPGWVYDSARDRFVLFGGGGPGALLYDATWRFDEAGWSQIEGAGPPARQAHAMAYDPRRDRVVVFGGIGTGSPRTLGDTWEFDGERWTQVAAPGPAPRHSAGMAFDSRRGVMVLFGGMHDGGSPGGTYGDTWTWDGAVWRKVAESGPPARGMGPLAYDVRRDRIVLFGGRAGPPYTDLSDTWEWDGTRWLPAM
ncbi:MAG TPA: kelch repeat-containing protein [Brevundimonas sp.]|jgi:hypothetical protein|uniref:Kelch repeat-containing protein n=1 Tax=Brevundimonas sp. TaxID=1871086 RepID=UPI002ED9FC8D